MAMTTLSRRLKNLEGRFGVGSEPVVHVIRFIEADGTVAETLTVVHSGDSYKAK